jgi:phosphoribosylaminoimidazolecarboxamide formyltransferase/IMP cyclohydrolase
MVIVNLYPFEEKLKEKLSESQMIEYIDIGGVSLLRAAAKNFSRVTVLCQPQQYTSVEQSLTEAIGKMTNVRRSLAQVAFQRTTDYDRAIANYLSSLDHQQDQASTEDLPPTVNLKLSQYQSLRYGENPHQAAVWYADSKANGKVGLDSFPPFLQLQGKELSSNNITDTYCLVKILRDLVPPAACIIKHNNPCGVAQAKTLEEAYNKAYETDPTSAFGGIYGFTGKVSGKLAGKITEGFVEIVAAPDFEQEALAVFQQKKNLRVLKLKNSVLKPTDLTSHTAAVSWHWKNLEDFGWILEKDIEPPVQPSQFQCMTGDNVSGQLLADAAFAWAVVKHLTSNAIFIVKDGCSIGFGIGQTSRIASVEIALKQAGENAGGAVMASDAFFPATDNIEAAARAGISLIVQPGGSLKDKDVIAACNKAQIKMLFTGQRCFKH